MNFWRDRVVTLEYRPHKNAYFPIGIDVGPYGFQHHDETKEYVIFRARNYCRACGVWGKTTFWVCRKLDTNNVQDPTAYEVQVVVGFRGEQ